MDALKLHSQIVSRYEEYIRSFIDIRDKDIDLEVKSALESGKLWPEPLIQFNPSYLKAASIADLSNEGILHPEIQKVFSGYQLYAHQEEALRMGAQGKSFVVTSGTGSGKSLTYLGTIFNSLFSSGFGKGIKALIVYPMNALINSQMEELKKYAQNYQNSSGSDLPLTFSAYTGQTGDSQRADILKNPPDILLTNYMMLELMMTRHAESDLRTSLFSTLEHLAFDELHTYRGRQGADVSYLIRRIRAACAHPVQAMGTSATMSSKGTFEEQQKAVAQVASKIFGLPIPVDQVIGEKLERSLKWVGSLPSTEQLKSAVDNGINSTRGLNELIAHPSCCWVENELALELAQHGLKRRTPVTLEDAAVKFSKAAGITQDIAASHLRDLLDWIAKVNEAQLKAGERYTCLPFKIHQFFAQTGSVYATLGSPTNRRITLEPGLYETGEEGRFVFPHVFSRASGWSYICVHLQAKESIFLPREFNDTEARNNDDFGYIIPEYSDSEDDLVWREDDEHLGQLPSSWVSESATGRKFVKKYQPRRPIRIHYDDQGNYSFSNPEPFPHSGWFMSAAQNGLLFDPTAGLFFDPQTNERTKLTTLGNEGRSTSTTVTSFLVLQELAAAGYQPWDQKLLSFTDNRQDAALQSGHFNDFIRIVRVRSAVYQALSNSQAPMTSKDLGRRAREAMNLSKSVYSRKAGLFPAQQAAVDASLETFLTYQAIHDLRRGWRVVLPNLEKCALLEIDYALIDENAAFKDGWSNVPIFKDLTNEKRANLLRDVLDFFRLEYAIHSKNWLNENIVSENVQQIRADLRDQWTIETKDAMKPRAMRTKKLHRRYRGDTGSLGIQSSLGKFFKHFAQQEELDVDLKKPGYEFFITQLLKALENCGYLEAEKVRDSDNEDTFIYRLILEKIIWKKGGGKKVKRDPVKQRSYGDFETKPNRFFRSLYETDFGKIKTLIGADHTGQLNNQDRLDREERFRAEWKIDDGEKEVRDELKVWSDSISALFCSPTMELGIDISNLSVVHLRNAPPNAANYAQRGGRAGRSGQAALVFTYCSTYSPHDRHYFKHREELVAGSVEAPRLDISNPELILSHLHAAFMTLIGLPGVRNSALDLVDIESESLPLKDEIKMALQLSTKQVSRLSTYFLKVLEDQSKNPGLEWCTAQWISTALSKLESRIDLSMDRWRVLLREAKSANTKATTILESGLHPTSSEEYKRARREQFQAHRQLELLRNDTRKLGSQSEFYIFRYLAAEGFLPGYNFTRLPVRAFLTDGYEKGEYISRPRLIGLREFGPQNVVYYNGAKYSITRAVVPNVHDTLTQARVCTSSGYWLDKDQDHLETCPITGADLSQSKHKRDLKPIMPLCEMLARSKEYITCEEEERMRQGFDIETYFSLDGGDASRIRKALVLDSQDELLQMKYLPAARLIQVATKDRRQTEEGFTIGLETGQWNPRIDDEDGEETKRPMLYTETTADSLYLQPIEALALDKPGVLSLQYALKRAIEIHFQIEPAELGVHNMGDPKAPNILFYEASEGSLGVLSQLATDPNAFQEVIRQAIKVCDYLNAAKKEQKATYDDLLSYYNQPHHLEVDRFSIKQALERLAKCSMDCSGSKQDEDYEAQFLRLMSEKDSSSSTEEVFLKYLYKHGLRLPDSAQKSVEGIYTKPDFFYEPDTWIFCDGTPHDLPDVKADDIAKRKAIRNKGDQVITYYYKDSLDQLVSKYTDIFKKVK